MDIVATADLSADVVMLCDLNKTVRADSCDINKGILACSVLFLQNALCAPTTYSLVFHFKVLMCIYLHNNGINTLLTKYRNYIQLFALLPPWEQFTAFSSRVNLSKHHWAFVS